MLFVYSTQPKRFFKVTFTFILCFYCSTNREKKNLTSTSLFSRKGKRLSHIVCVRSFISSPVLICDENLIGWSRQGHYQDLIATNSRASPVCCSCECVYLQRIPKLRTKDIGVGWRKRNVKQVWITLRVTHFYLLVYFVSKPRHFIPFWTSCFFAKIVLWSYRHR